MYKYSFSKYSTNSQVNPIFQKRTSTGCRGSSEVALVPALSTAEAASSSSSATAEAFSPRPVAFLAIDSAIASVIALGRLERKLFDFRTALGASEPEFGNVKELSLRTILIVHFSFRLNLLIIPPPWRENSSHLGERLSCIPYIKDIFGYYA
jgi:hypothetical protein